MCKWKNAFEAKKSHVEKLTTHDGLLCYNLPSYLIVFSLFRMMTATNSGYNVPGMSTKPASRMR
jgi:hypothetical protein